MLIQVRPGLVLLVRMSGYIRLGQITSGYVKLGQVMLG
jgi:hypothetical protein